MLQTSAIMFGALGLASVLGACAPYPLHERMTDAEIRRTITEEIPPGSSPTDVGVRLTDLRVSERARMEYPPRGEPPRVLLARLFEPGGFHINDEDDLVQWVDVSFVFAPADGEQGSGEGLERVLLFRDGIRYFQGEPVSRPKRAPAGRVYRAPFLPPPPHDPLEGAQ